MISLVQMVQFWYTVVILVIPYAWSLEGYAMVVIG